MEEEVKCWCKKILTSLFLSSSSTLVCPVPKPKNEIHFTFGYTPRIVFLTVLDSVQNSPPKKTDDSTLIQLPSLPFPSLWCIPSNVIRSDLYYHQVNLIVTYTTLLESTLRHIHRNTGVDLVVTYTTTLLGSTHPTYTTLLESTHRHTHYIVGVDPSSHELFYNRMRSKQYSHHGNLKRCLTNSAYSLFSFTTF